MHTPLHPDLHDEAAYRQGRFDAAEYWGGRIEQITRLLRAAVGVLFVVSWLLMFLVGGTSVIGSLYLHVPSGTRVSGEWFAIPLAVAYIAIWLLGMLGADAAQDGRTKPFTVYVICVALSLLLTPVILMIPDSLTQLR